MAVDTDAIRRSIDFGETYADEIELRPMHHADYRMPIGQPVKTLLYEMKYRAGKPSGFHFNNGTFVDPKNSSFFGAVLPDQRAILNSPSVISIQSGDIIDVIVNNIDYSAHPFHLHGHRAWVVAIGATNGSYLHLSNVSNVQYNWRDPIYRDTYTVNPYSHIVFRFKADNPGIWLMNRSMRSNDNEQISP
jgi:iron transport multicopper oxidase